MKRILYIQNQIPIYTWIRSEDSFNCEMPSAKSYYHRKPGRFAKERKEFQRLVEELKRITLEHGYPRNEIAAELDVNLQSVLPKRRT